MPSELMYLGIEQQQLFSSVQLLSHVRLCNPMDCSTPGFPVHHQLPELTQTQTQGRKELDTTEAI